MQVDKTEEIWKSARKECPCFNYNYAKEIETCFATGVNCKYETCFATGVHCKYETCPFAYWAELI